MILSEREKVVEKLREENHQLKLMVQKSREEGDNLQRQKEHAESRTWIMVLMESEGRQRKKGNDPGTSR
jgi:predicted RNase H-like nuclease (RuvC/YqgF family)